MNDQIKSLLFNHHKVDSSLYYLSGTVVLTIAIIGLLLIILYSIYKSSKRNHGAEHLVDEVEKLKKIDLKESIIVFLSSFFCFIISLRAIPEAIIVGGAENLAAIIIFPFILAMLFGGLEKVKSLKKGSLLRELKFWRVYSFVLIFMLLRLSAF